MKKNNYLSIFDISRELTPRQVVKELDQYIVGQKDAKKSVSIALRNRYRRKKLSKELADDIAPKNILMIGPTGVGKTEIARRLARLTSSPFMKIEASKFTEVGYVGRDVESMIRDLTEISVDMVKTEKIKQVKETAEERAEEKLLDILFPKPKSSSTETYEEKEEKEARWRKHRQRWRKKLREGDLDERMVELDVKEKSIKPTEIFSNAGLEDIGISIQGIFPDNMFPSKTKRKKMKVKEAKKYLLEEEERSMIDMDEVVRIARDLVEQTGIIFLDEIDKIAGKESDRGPNVSRAGVQRDLLPLIEGTSVHTKHGIVKTDHILFIGAGAFHATKPSDLIPELQGRFPIRVELQSLGRKEFKRILKEPKNALTKQYISLLHTEDIDISFTDNAIDEIARLAEKVNQETENIGARRLHTIMEKVMEDISFDAPDIKPKKIAIDKKYINEKLEDIVQDEDLSKYIL